MPLKRLPKFLAQTFLVFGIVLLSANVFSADKLHTGNQVRIEGEKGAWHLTVNGKPFSLKGVGVGRGIGRFGAVDYLKLAQELGANCVRTWGVDQGDEAYLNTAHEYGLYVNAGIWLEWDSEEKPCSYLKNDDCKNRLRKQALEYVRKYKNHPAVLFWNIGNETIHFTKDENERIAIARFLEGLIKEVKEIDPHHPVIYTSAYLSAIDYVAEYVPSLDIFGMNVYGGLEHAHDQIVDKLNIPYVVTEFGPLGPWDMRNDVNGRPSEASDRSKTHNYKMLARIISKCDGNCLGGFAFHLGDTTQNSFTWWNLTFRQYKKLPYLAVQSFYTGKKLNQEIPLVNYMDFSRRKDLKPKEYFSVEVGVADSSLENLRFEYLASTDIDHVPVEYPNVEIPLEIKGEGASVEIQAPEAPGIYRVYVVVITPQGYASSLSKTISVSSVLDK